MSLLPSPRIAELCRRAAIAMVSVAAIIQIALNGAAARADDVPCTLETTKNDRWTLRMEQGSHWLVTPCGDRFFSTGVNVLDGGYPMRERLGKIWYSWHAFAPTLDAWIAETNGRLKEWGFNSAGGWSLPPDRLRLPEIANLELGRYAQFHWFDPFSTATETTMMEAAKRLVAPYRASPYRIGYFSDNEVGWWNGALFVFYSQQPAETATKQRWVRHIRQSYGDDWQRFTVDFVPPPDAHDWSSLTKSREITRLKPGGRGIAVVRSWTGLITERYYALVEKSIRAADPNALIFGDRLPIYYDPIAVRAAARHVDIIATNYNVDSPDGWVARYFFDGLHQLSNGKPILVSEWFYAATENRTGNINNGHLMTVKTQNERASGAAQAIGDFARIPDLVGLHWFQYADHPKGGRDDGEDYNFGLVDIDNRPYEALTQAMSPALKSLPERHLNPKRFPDRLNDRKDLAIPYAELNFDDQSLVGWPKMAALLPSLVPSPGEVPFGEAYLAWNKQGLALATIGQDYVDLDLLAYDGAFPLTEAYRVSLSVDGGAGPHTVTLFFIPPKTKVKDHPPMTALLCQGTPPAATDLDHRCVPVAGALTRYFGADQPRITAEMLLPWSALGLDAPPSTGQIRFDITSSAWHRSRFMSLSGMNPAESAVKPHRWLSARLGPVS